MFVFSTGAERSVPIQPLLLASLFALLRILVSECCVLIPLYLACLQYSPVLLVLCFQCSLALLSSVMSGLSGESLYWTSAVETTTGRLFWHRQVSSPEQGRWG